MSLLIYTTGVSVSKNRPESIPNKHCIFILNVKSELNVLHSSCYVEITVSSLFRQNAKLTDSNHLSLLLH